MTAQQQPQQPPPQSQPTKTDPEDMSRPGPITFVILAGLACFYAFYSYHDRILAFLGLQ
jgi:hypothetical protein